MMYLTLQQMHADTLVHSYMYILLKFIIGWVCFQSYHRIPHCKTIYEYIQYPLRLLKWYFIPSGHLLWEHPVWQWSFQADCRPLPQPHSASSWYQSPCYTGYAACSSCLPGNALYVRGNNINQTSTYYSVVCTLNKLYSLLVSQLGFLADLQTATVNQLLHLPASVHAQGNNYIHCP